MNRVHLDQIIDKYIVCFTDLNTGGHDEFYKWEIAYSFRSMLDEALAADDTNFPAKLASVVLLTKQTIDNRYELSFYALVDYARKEPAIVREAIHKLLEADGGDLIIRRQRFIEFLDFCHAMKKKYYPDSWRYTASIRLPMMITGFYDPDHYYLYKASQAIAYADCVEFYDNWGSGSNMDLRIYHRMCDELVEVIKSREDLINVNSTRYSFSNQTLHPDRELHILAFDIVFCSTVYDLYEGIHYAPKNAAEKKAYIAKVNEARQVADQQADALEQALKLDHAEAFFAEKLSVGNPIAHKKFGVGRIISLPSIYTIEVEFPGKEKPSKLVWRDCVKAGLLSFKDENNASEYDEMVTLIRRADLIRKSVIAAEKKLEEYAEYL